MKNQRILQLYIFTKPPRAIPPVVNVKEIHGEAFLRAIRRAAWQPWRDARFWRDAAAHVAASPLEGLAGRDLAQVCLSFQKIQIGSAELTEYIQRYFAARRQSLNTFELAVVLSYFIGSHAGGPGTESFVQSVADEACIEWRQRETVPWSAWKMFVLAASQAGVPHQELFTLASTHLERNVRFMRGSEAVEICCAYAALRFKHTGLFNEISRFVSSMSLKDTEVEMLHEAFRELEHDAPLLQRIRELQVLGRYTG